jgi:hypothetical protein
MDVERSHTGYTLAEYAKMGYVLKTSKKVGPYFEKIPPLPTIAPVAPVQRKGPTFGERVAAVLVMLAVLWAVVHAILSA